MLTVDDTPTIRNAIQKRLDQEPGIKACHIDFGKYPDSHVAVAISINLGEVCDGHYYAVESRFDLPDPFEYSHLMNEIDQVAEHVKAARKDFFGRGIGGLIKTPSVQPAGTGRRGLWKQYGLTRA